MQNFKFQKVMFDALKESGEILRGSFQKEKDIEFKDTVSLVTEVDKNSEKKIIEIIKDNYPDHGILAEESIPEEGDSEFKWIIDPLDGTTNYVHFFPQACISIALEKEGIVIMGGVYDPFHEELFFAEMNKGAYLNEKRINVSKTESLAHALLLTGFPYDRQKMASFYLKFYKKFLERVQDIRRLGSASLDLCYIACGRLDGFWEFKLNPWDVAAGKLIVEEAGGKLSDFRGEKYSIYGQETIATNGLIHDEMLEIMKKPSS